MIRSFYDWLHEPEPDWKVNLEQCDTSVFRVLKMEKRQVEEILEVLHEFGVFEKATSEE